MKKWTVFCVIAALLFLVIAAASFRDDVFSTYVPVRDAMQRAGEHVQVMGALDKATIAYERGGGYTFTVRDGEENEMRVYKEGIKPMNFEHADNVVLVGSYNRDRGLFVADKVLTKCPSRYAKGK
ncbi:MAG: cytochrome c maturation protein CcmE [Spirochaetes bacterium]|nr:cytochrome c maturation protein CcmE [Spirochaetota bacterium]